MSPELRGIFLTSKEPQLTAKFYRDVAELELEQVGNLAEYVYWKVDKAGLQLAIHDAERFAQYTHSANPQSNLTHLYFKIDDQRQFLERLRALCISPMQSTTSSSRLPIRMGER